jgi:branched-chain amino acid transport system substrate-binding protein
MDTREENYWTKRRRYSRRGFIRGLGVAAGVVSLAPVIAACGSNSNNSTKNSSKTTSGAAATSAAAAATAAATSAAAAPSASGATAARKASAPGVTTDTILLGTTQPLSGPASSYLPIIQTVQAYFQKVNEGGGVNGRQIKINVEDDKYDPANTPALIKKLVEQDHVFATAFTLGTPTNSAVVDYLNENKVPMLVISSGAGKWGDVKKYPWSMGFQISYPIEGHIYGKYIAATWPGKKVGILYQNDDFGKDYLSYKDTIGSNNPTVDEESYETTASDVSTQITNLKAKGVEVFILIAIPKYAGLALKAAADQNWHPNVVMTSVSADPSLMPLAGGAQNVEGVISDGWAKQYDSGDPSINDVKDLLTKYAPNTQLSNFAVTGYMYALWMTETLKRAGVNPTRDSLMAAAESYDKFVIPQLLNGSTISTSKTDHYPVKSAQLAKATSGKFVYFGDVLSG